MTTEQREALVYIRDMSSDAKFILGRLLDEIGGLSVDHRQRVETVRRQVQAIHRRAAALLSPPAEPGKELK